MNHTNHIILKLLLQQPLKEKELLKYLNINIITLKNSLFQINIKLADLKLPIIKEQNCIYKISLSKQEREIFYKSANEYSQTQRINYLSLKILIEKKLNLEKERKILNISRSTIVRDMISLKNNLENYNIFLISKKWEGIFCKAQNNADLYQYLCQILIIFYSEYNYLPGILKYYLDSIQLKKMESTLIDLFQIFENFNLQVGNTTIRYFLSLNTCVLLFEDFYLASVLNYIKEINNTKEFKEIYSKISSMNILDKKLDLYMSVIIYDTLYKTFYLEDTFNKKTTLFCNYFNLILEKDEKSILNLFLYLSNFRYEYKLYDVKNIYIESEFDKKILQQLDKFLKKINLNILYGDLLELLDFTKYFFIQNNKKYNKKILILKKDINITYYVNLKHHLKQIYPNFIFEIKPHAYIYIANDINKIYDFVLSDITLDSNFNYKLCQVNLSLITSINNFLIEDYIKTKSLGTFS